MDSQQQQQQWTAYSAEPSPAARPRYSMASPQHAQRDASVPAPVKQEIKQEPYSSLPPSRQSSMGLQSGGGSSSRGADFNDGDGDVAMEDADPYKPKYNTARPNHQNRHSQQFLQHEESAAARRYSPMNLSPTSPYTGSTQQGGQNYTSFSPQAQAQSQPQSNRQSPTRNNPYISPPNSYYSPPCTSRLSSQGLPWRCHTNHYSCSLATTCASTPAHTVQHEPRELLPAERDGAIERRVQQGSTLAAYSNKPESSSASACGRRPGAQVPAG
jgi:dual specificity protein kinase YAK1